MPRETRTSVTYHVDITPESGPAELDARTGKPWNDHHTDEPWVYTLVRRTGTEVFDGRGRNWRAGTHTDEVIATLTPVQVAALIASAAERLMWAGDMHNRNLAIVRNRAVEV